MDVESEVLRASLRLCRSRYPCIHLAADVISGLARHQDRVAVKAVDAVLEAMHRGIEVRACFARELVLLRGEGGIGVVEFFHWFAAFVINAGTHHFLPVCAPRPSFTRGLRSSDLRALVSWHYPPCMC